MDSLYFRVSVCFSIQRTYFKDLILGVHSKKNKTFGHLISLSIDGVCVGCMLPSCLYIIECICEHKFLSLLLRTSSVTKYR